MSGMPVSQRRFLERGRTISQSLEFLNLQKKGYTVPHEYWFWPSYTWEEEENEDDENEDEEDDSHNNKEQQECEGISNELLEQEHEQDIGTTRISIEELDEVFEPAEQLDIISSYLRATYFYCLWCCTEYEDLDDLTTHCPGSTRSDHD